MREELRMIGDYKVIASQVIGYDEIIIGENPKAVFNEKYLCCFVDRNQIFESYREAVVSGNYAEIVKEYANRISNSAEKVIKEQEKELIETGDDSEITYKMCEGISFEDNLKDKVIVVRGDALKPEYQRATHQLMLCTGGFGSQPNSRGRTCYCIGLYDGKKTSFYRSDFLGIMDVDKLPEWAKKGLERAKEIYEEEKTPPKSRGEAR